MPKTNILRTLRRLKYRYLTLNNVVIAVAFLIAVSWAWGSIGMMQRNYALQKEVDYKRRQALIVELETKNLEYEQRYYESAEYQELTLRERLGVGLPGEKVIVLPENSSAAGGEEGGKAAAGAGSSRPSNVQQWATFLFGGNQSRRRGFNTFATYPSAP